MGSTATVGDLFALAIAAEECAAELYRGLVARFAHHSAIAEFWQRYITDEVAHACWLRGLRDDLSAAQLAAPAAPEVVEDARLAANVPVEKLLADVRNLDDAYELVNDLENSETNAVFEFLIATFPAEQSVQTFLRAQLRGHVNRLVAEFPEQCKDPDARQAVCVQVQEDN